MNIKQNIFSGARPSAAISLLGPGEAQIAQNCKLEKGDLRPWKQYKNVKVVSGLGTPQTLYLHKKDEVDFWIAENGEYDFARSPVAGDTHNRLYFTGGSEPRVIADDLFADTLDFHSDYYKLGVPAPVAAPTIDAGYTAGLTYRAYVYSYVVRLGVDNMEEGPPSPFAAIEDYGSGDVTLSGFTEPPADREIGTIYIYRTNSATSGIAAFQFVGEFQTAGFDFAAGTFTDGVAEADLGTDGPQPETFIPPPAGLKGLIALVNGAFAGFVGNVVYISEPNLPHAWPYEYPVDSMIIGLGWFGSTCVALTDSHVYFLLGAPEAMEVMKLDGKYPCISKRGIISDVGQEGGVIFPTEDGWAMTNQNGVKTISIPFIDPTSWRDNFHPTTTHAYFYEGKIFAFSASQSYVIDFNNDRFTTLNVYPDACHRARGTGTFYIIKANEDTVGTPDSDHAIYQWEADGDDFLQFTWRSMKKTLAYITNFSVARVIRSAAELATIEGTIVDNDAAAAANLLLIATGDIGGDIGDEGIDADDGFEIDGDGLAIVLDLDINADLTFNLYADGTLIHTETVQDDEPFRLPADVLYKHVEYEVIGYVPIIEIALATSVEELDGVPNA